MLSQILQKKKFRWNRGADVGVHRFLCGYFTLQQYKIENNLNTKVGKSEKVIFRKFRKKSVCVSCDVSFTSWKGEADSL